MTDSELTILFFSRDEKAVAEAKLLYGTYCKTVALNILRSEDDADECVADALLAAWQSIPPARPENLRTYLAKLTRNAAISRWRRTKAEKRGSGHIELLLEELSDAAGSDNALDRIDDTLSLREAFNSFLASLGEEQRRIFLRRYWYMHSISEIAGALGISESKVKVTLSRTRSKLKKLLEREGLL
ncbi:MAG: RNA polymerase sigma factor [Ruminococcus sp.]|nr:RNA polymerase sigma factor [Ruminococcus sp.]